jgi:2-polyprenyl-3-methyl-5-hydroxy-6-metoxy-1,4-benzoquinol methylase
MGSPPWESGVSPPELMEFIEINPPSRAIDLGCGTGTNVITLAQHGWQVTGIDFVSKAIRTARRKAKEAGVSAELRVGDVTKLENLGGGYDLVLDMGCYHGLSSHQRLDYQQNLTHIINPGGTYMLYAFLKEDELSRHGVSDADIRQFSQFLHLQSRENDEGEDTFGPSSWFWFIHGKTA